MNDFMQMDIFFFITSVFIIVLTLVVIGLAWYLYKIFREIKKIILSVQQIVSELKAEGSATIASFADVRARAEDALKNTKGMKSFASLVAVSVVGKVVDLLIKRAGRKR